MIGIKSMHFPSINDIIDILSEDELLIQLQNALLNGANIHDTMQYMGFNILEVIIYCVPNRSIAQFLINCGATCPRVHTHHNSNMSSVVPLLINSGLIGVNDNIDDSSRRFPLLAWTGEFNLDIFKELIELGANTFALVNNQSIFDYLTVGRFPSTISEIIIRGLDVAPVNLKKLTSDAQITALYKIITT
jgi:hypothetical protein